MKVLHIVSSIGVRNGMMSVLMNYYRTADNLNIKFDFAYLYEQDKTYQSEINKLGGKTYFLNNHNPLQIRKNIYKLLSKGDYDIIHCHPLFAFMLIPKTSTPVIQHSHSVKPSAKPLSAIRNILLLHCFAKSKISAYAGCSKDALTIFSCRELKRKPSFVLNNAIDPQKYLYSKTAHDKIRSKLSIPNDAFVVGCIGRLSSEKNQSRLIDAFALVSNELDNSRLVLVGDGLDKNRLSTQIKNQNLTDKVIMTGLRTDIPNLLSSFDLFVLPSKFEGIGLVAIEAQANGLPTIISTGVPDEARLSPHTIKIDVNDKYALADAILSAKTLKRSDNNKTIDEGGFNINLEFPKLITHYHKISTMRSKQ